MNYLEHQFSEIEDLMEKHKKTLKERSSQKEFCSELHRLLDTEYIVYHQELVEFKGSNAFKRMEEKTRDFHGSRLKEISDRYKMELDNYEKNRGVDENLHKALDGLYNSEKLHAGYACMLKYNLISDWEESSNLENAKKKAYKTRKKY